MTKIPSWYRDQVQRRLLESAEVKTKVAKDCLDSILTATKLIIDTFESGGKVLICGNGGSAADAQHMACELVCVLNKTFDRPGFPAMALTTDTSILTAYSNDFGFTDVFKRQVLALGRPGDLVIGISTSGTSENISSAIKAARASKMHTLLLTGNNLKINKKADIVIRVPSINTQYIQESHIAIIHIVCELVEKYFYEKIKDK